MTQPPSPLPMVSVVMPVLNPHPIYFREAIASVVAQTLGDFELIVVEDPSAASADNTLAQFSDCRVIHIRNSTPTGLVAQLNQGLTVARAELVARFDADDICEPDRLAKQVAFLEAHPQIDVLGSQLTVIDTDGKVLGYREYPLGHEAIRRAFPRYSPIAQPAVMFRKTSILKVGGYKETRNRVAEDYDLWSRLIKSGATFANHPECLLRYRLHPQASKNEKLRESLLATLDVKRTYWLAEMRPMDRLRMLAEGLLLYLPPRIVLRLFTATHLKTRKPHAGR